MRKHVDSIDPDFWLTLGRTERWSREKLVALQNRRLRRLVEHAYAHSPYYRELYQDHGIDPNNIRTIDDLPSLPVPDRDAFRQDIGHFLRPGIDPGSLRDVRTSSTSGHVLTLPSASRELRFEEALCAVDYHQRGVRPWDVIARIKLPAAIPAKKRLCQRFGLLRREYLDVRAPPTEKVAWLRRLKPRLLMGWASILEEVCTELERTDSILPIPMVFSSAETLRGALRKRIEECFHARALNIYASAETGIVAWEIPGDRGLRVKSDVLIVEAVDDDGKPCSRGNILCTVLWRKTVPLIRYPLGDVIEWAEPRCIGNNPHPVIGKLHGRDTSVITLPSGRVMSELAVDGIFSHFSGIHRYQFIQRDAQSFLAKVVPGQAYSEAEIKALVARMLERWQDIRIDVETTNEIYQPQEAKFTPFISLQRLAQLRRQGISTETILGSEARGTGLTEPH